MEVLADPSEVPDAYEAEALVSVLLGDAGKDHLSYRMVRNGRHRGELRAARARSMAAKLIRSCSRRTAGPNVPVTRSR